LLNGSTPGIHFPEDEYYIRRIRFSAENDLLPDLANAGYPESLKLRTIELFHNKKWIACEKSIHHNATLNFTMSSNISYSIKNDYGCPEDKIKCVLVGSNVEQKKLNKLSNKKEYLKNILFVGVDWERKGGPILEKAFKKVLQKHPDSSLTIVGCSPKLELENCTVVGNLPLQEVLSYYEKADIFCLPTLREPFGIVFIEAMAYELPIVATDIGVIPDFIINGKNGYRVKPEDFELLAEKLIELLDSPEKCEAFGKYGAHHIASEYRWEKVGKKIYDSIENSLKTDKNLS